MNRRFFTAFGMIFLLLAAECSKTVEVDPYSPGVCVAECHVDASKGQLSVLVETEGTWRLKCADGWLSTDVPGGSGRGAFTFSYASNESDILHLRRSRTGSIVLCLDDSGRVDTLRVVQQGFLSPITKGNTQSDPALRLEFEESSAGSHTLLVLCTDGLAEASEWADGKADISVIDGSVSGDSGSLVVLGCDFSGLDASAEYTAFRAIVDAGLEAEGDTGLIVCGTMNHLSMMQTGYPETPQWYPSDARDELFRADRYAWQNKLYDILWMKEQGYAVTYTDGDSRSYAADYIYVSPPVLAKVSDVQVLDIPVAGMQHHPLLLTLNF